MKLEWHGMEGELGMRKQSKIDIRSKLRAELLLLATNLQPQVEEAQKVQSSKPWRQAGQLQE